MSKHRRKPNRAAWQAKPREVPPEFESNSEPKARIYRNPSGRSARIVPDLRPSRSDQDNQTEVDVSPVLPPTSLPAPVAATTPSPIAAGPSEDEGDFSSSHVTGSYRREKAMEGLLLGASIGNAVGLGRSGLSRRSSLKIMGRGPLEYCLIPGVGIVGGDSHRMIMTLQSILRSRSQVELFRRNLAMRLRFYFLSLPVSAGKTTLLAALRLWLGVPADQSGIDSSDNSSLINALAISAALQGTGHSIDRWVTVSTEITHMNPETIDSSILIARAGYLAIMTDPQNFSPDSLVERLINVTENEKLKAGLIELRAGIGENLSSHAMAKRFGWGNKVPATAAPTAIMAIYAWLRNQRNYQDVVERAVLLGGDSATMGALAGGLAGIHLGAKQIPQRWTKRLWSWPNDRKWLDSLTRRFTDWPHGSEDLHTAPALPTRALLQLARSCVLTGGVAIGAIVKIPWKLSHWVTG